MKKFLKKIAIFFVPLLLFFILVNYWMGREYYPHYPLQYEEVFHPKINADVIILGASHATHGINPKYLETDRLRVFNFALNGAPPEFNLRWYKKIFRVYYKKPHYVIYGVHWGMFDDHILRRKFEQDSKYFSLSFFIREFGDLKNLRVLLFNRFALFRERRTLLRRLFKGESREFFLLSGYYNGFIPYEIKRNLGKEEVVYPKDNPSQIEAFFKLLDELEKDDIKVIFVQVPGYRPEVDAGKISKHVQFLKSIAEKRNIPFLDYDTERICEINYHRDYFSDVGHLNKKGSEEFSKLLDRDLKAFLQ